MAKQKTFSRVLTYVKPYWGSIVLNLVFNLMAIFFSLFRKVIIVVPLTLLLPGLGFGVDGVFLAEPISNVLGGLACFIAMWFTLYKKLPEDGQEAHI